MNVPCKIYEKRVAEVNNIFRLLSGKNLANLLTISTDKEGYIKEKKKKNKKN